MKTYRSSRLQEVPEIEGVTDKFKYEIGSKYSSMAQKLIHLDLVKIDFLNTLGLLLLIAILQQAFSLPA